MCILRPIPLNPPNACELEQSVFVQKSLPFTPCEQSDTDGLTLNISVPITIETPTDLPVFTFVHGGGWMTGSTAYPQYDLVEITRLSVEVGMPMIAVGIWYVFAPFEFWCRDKHTLLTCSPLVKLSYGRSRFPAFVSHGGRVICRITVWTTRDLHSAGSNKISQALAVTHSV